MAKSIRTKENPESPEENATNFFKVDTTIPLPQKASVYELMEFKKKLDDTFSTLVPPKTEDEIPPSFSIPGKHFAAAKKFLIDTYGENNFRIAYTDHKTRKEARVWKLG